MDFDQLSMSLIPAARQTPLPADTGKIMWGPISRRPVAAAAHLGWLYYDETTKGWSACLFGATGYAWVAVGAGAANLFDHYTDLATTHTDGTEDDLYSDTLAAGQLAANGDKIDARYVFSIVAHASATRQIRGYFGGTAVFDSTAFAWSSGGTLWADVSIIRVSSTTVRAQGNLTFSALGKQALPAYTEITGLTLSNTQILKVTGAAGTGSGVDDIVARMGNVLYRAAA